MKIAGILLLTASGALFFSCGKQENSSSTAHFTKIDSLTDAYLSLQDSILHTWNVMIKDENEKLENIHILLEEMKDSDHFDKSEVESLHQRWEQLKRIRFTQKSMTNPHVVEEYDFASNSLITEVISLAESDPSFPQNTKLQQLTDLIKSADQRVSIYREDYDQVVDHFNQFLNEVKPFLHDIDEKSDGLKKALFYSEDDL